MIQYALLHGEYAATSREHRGRGLDLRMPQTDALMMFWLRRMLDTQNTALMKATAYRPYGDIFVSPALL